MGAVLRLGAYRQIDPDEVYRSEAMRILGVSEAVLSRLIQHREVAHPYRRGQVAYAYSRVEIEALKDHPDVIAARRRTKRST
jgi:hypothetical protein